MGRRDRPRRTRPKKRDAPAMNAESGSGERVQAGVLGRTGRLVTTLGLGGQAGLMLTPEGVDPVAIIDKAYRLGVTYFDTANAYGPSQGHYGTAFRSLGLVRSEEHTSEL